MPTYVYQCQECGTVYEMHGTYKELEERLDCPECNSENTRKVYSPAQIRFKGSGFYTTDNKKGLDKKQ